MGGGGPRRAPDRHHGYSLGQDTRLQLARSRRRCSRARSWWLACFFFFATVPSLRRRPRGRPRSRNSSTTRSFRAQPLRGVSKPKVHGAGRERSTVMSRRRRCSPSRRRRTVVPRLVARPDRARSSRSSGTSAGRSWPAWTAGRGAGPAGSSTSGCAVRIVAAASAAHCCSRWTERSGTVAVHNSA